MNDGGGEEVSGYLLTAPGRPRYVGRVRPKKVGDDNSGVQGADDVLTPASTHDQSGMLKTARWWEMLGLVPENGGYLAGCQVCRPKALQDATTGRV